MSLRLQWKEQQSQSVSERILLWFYRYVSNLEDNTNRAIGASNPEVALS